MKLTVAAAQTDPHLGDSAHNLGTMETAFRAAADANLVVFPECALSGYGFENREDALRAAEPIPGPATEKLAALCRDRGSWIIVGMLERDGEALYNSAALISPDGIAGVYRKMHLPFLGVDRFADPGDLGFPVFTLPWGRIGINICYDLSFPEASRCLKLAGAQLIVVPTNWPLAAEVSCIHSPPVRAQENHLFVVTCDRVGEEAGFRFRGQSRACSPDGQVLALAGDTEETLTTTLHLPDADDNRIIHVPGAYELDRIAHRRPTHYGPLTRP